MPATLRPRYKGHRGGRQAGRPHHKGHKRRGRTAASWKSKIRPDELKIENFHTSPWSFVACGDRLSFPSPAKTRCYGVAPALLRPLPALTVWSNFTYGRNTASTINPTITPSTTIITGSKMLIIEPTITSTSSS